MILTCEFTNEVKHVCTGGGQALADSALKLSAASPPLNLEADFHSQQLVFARLQPVGVFEEQRDAPCLRRRRWFLLRGCDVGLLW